MLSKQLLAAALTGLVALGGVAAGPGPDGDNDKGLCTAYFNGQKNGHDNDNAGGNGNGNGRQPGEAPGPFYGLEQTAEEYADEQGAEYDTTEEAVYYFCTDTLGEDGIGGNPDENGRWTCYYVSEDDPETEENEAEVQCDENEAPGNSGNRGGGRL